MVKPVTVIAVALAPFLCLLAWPTVLLAAAAGAWAIVCVVLWAMLDSSNGPRREASRRCFGHDQASWEMIWAHNSEQQRKTDSRLSFGHENASWDEIKLDDRRREASQKIFGHPNASVAEINEHRRRKMSQKRFGHPDASIDEIRAYDRKHRRSPESSFGTGIDSSTGLKIGDGLILDPATGNITVRRS